MDSQPQLNTSSSSIILVIFFIILFTIGGYLMYTIP
jgi:hypothetical protein